MAQQGSSLLQPACCGKTVRCSGVQLIALYIRPSTDRLVLYAPLIMHAALSRACLYCAFCNEQVMCMWCFAGCICCRDQAQPHHHPAGSHRPIVW